MPAYTGTVSASATSGWEISANVPTLSGRSTFIVNGLQVTQLPKSGIFYAQKYVGERNVPHDIKRQRRYTFELMRRMGMPVLIKKMYTAADEANGIAVKSPNLHSVYGQTRNEDPISYGVGWCSKEESENEWIDSAGRILKSDVNPGAGFVKAPKYRGFGPGYLTYIIEPDVAEDFYKLTPEGALIRFQHAQAVTPWWPDVSDNDLIIHVTLDKNFNIVAHNERYQSRMTNPVSIRGDDRAGRREYSGEFGNRHVINQRFEMMLVPPQNILYKVEVDR